MRTLRPRHTVHGPGQPLDGFPVLIPTEHKKPHQVALMGSRMVPAWGRKPRPWLARVANQTV